MEELLPVSEKQNKKKTTSWTSGTPTATTPQHFNTKKETIFLLLLLLLLHERWRNVDLYKMLNLLGSSRDIYFEIINYLFLFFPCKDPKSGEFLGMDLHLSLS